MPARRLPWFKLWPEAMRHEKVVLLSDGAFRTWVVTLAAGSEQSTRWRFASVAHLVHVTGRPEDQVRELIGAKLLDLSPSGEVWVHDWRQWQDRYASDLAPRSIGEHSANAPRTLRNGSANIPAKLPGELRGEKRELRGEMETPPKPPPQAEGAWAPSATVDLSPLSADDVALWATARAEIVKDMLAVNARRVEALEPLGRGPDGGLRLRAPPGSAEATRFLGAIRAHLVGAGDTAGKHAVIVTT